jgi:hypothetical protein
MFELIGKIVVGLFGIMLLLGGAIIGMTMLEGEDHQVDYSLTLEQLNSREALAPLEVQTTEDLMAEQQRLEYELNTGESFEASANRAPKQNINAERRVKKMTPTLAMQEFNAKFQEHCPSTHSGNVLEIKDELWDRYDDSGVITIDGQPYTGSHTPISAAGWLVGGFDGSVVYETRQGKMICHLIYNSSDRNRMKAAVIVTDRNTESGIEYQFDDSGSRITGRVVHKNGDEVARNEW